MFGKRNCEPEEPKQCKPKKIKVVKDEPECVEPLPPEYVEKTYFTLGSPDPIVDERAKCLEDCHVKPIFEILKTCQKRVTRKLLYTAETCHEEIIDLMEALDKCVIDKGFNRLE